MKPAARWDPQPERADEIVAGLRAERIRQGFSQSAVARAIQAMRPSISAWESGRSRPAARSVRLLCEALGVPVPPDVDMVFRPDVPRCPSRPAYERHRKRRETCRECMDWMTVRRRKPGVKPRGTQRRGVARRGGE